MKNKLLSLLALHLGLAAVVAQPVITNQPQNQTNFAGTTAMFTVGATGAPPLGYQWRSHANPSSYTNIPFGTEATLVLTNVQPTNRRFAVVVTDSGGLSATSSPLVTLTVVTPPSVIPANPTASLFADVALFATNSSAAPLSYQWLFNGELIASAVTNYLVVTNIHKTNVGNYAIVARYAFGSATSQVATLKIVPFNSMYCFGDSWTDTHNCSWNASQFYHNHACNGSMWPEFLSTNLGLAYVESNNYAFCGASALDVLRQITNSFRVPARPALSLYVPTPGADFLKGLPPDGAGSGYLDLTNEVAWIRLVDDAIALYSETIEKLYSRGARSMVLGNQQDLAPSPRYIAALSTDPLRLGKLTQYIRRYNSAFRETAESFSKFKPDTRIYICDFFSQFESVVANPGIFGFTKTTIGALEDPLLVDKSFTGPGADYMYWNALHPTSKLHQFMATWTLETLTNAVLERLEGKLANSSATISMSHLLIGRDYTLQKSADLQRWEGVQIFTASAGTNQVSQAAEIGMRSMFYRLQWQQ